MPHSRKLFLFRHGETDWNREGRFQGHIDIALNEQGRAQARALAPVLAPHHLQGLLSSDLSRALETAEIVAHGLGGLPVFSDARLREANLGRAQGLTIPEIESRFGHERLRRWRSGDPTDAEVAYEGGESGTQVIARVFAALEEFLRDHAEIERVGVATHGGVIRRILQRVLGTSDNPPPIHNGSLHVVVFEGGRWKPSI